MRWPWSSKRNVVAPPRGSGDLDRATWLPPTPLATRETPRQVIARHFKSLKGGLPIQGGWGYTQGTACIICRNDPLNEPGLAVDGVGIEYAFVEKRCYEELVLCRPRGDAHCGIRWTLKKQALISGEDGRKYDRLVFEISCFRERDWESLKAEYERGRNDPHFDLEAHRCRHESLRQRYLGEYWFDITSFFGR